MSTTSGLVRFALLLGVVSVTTNSEPTTDNNWRCNEPGRCPDCGGVLYRSTNGNVAVCEDCGHDWSLRAMTE